MSQKPQRGKIGQHLHTILTLSDVIIINIVYLIVNSLTDGFATNRQRLAWLLVNVAYLPTAYLLGKSHRARTIPMNHVLRNAFKAVGVHALTFITLLYFLEFDFIPWQTLALFYGLLLVALPLWWSCTRLMVKELRSRGYNYRRIVIVGTGPTAMRLYDELMSDAGFGYRVLGFFDNTMSPDFKPTELYRGPIAGLEQFIADNSVDEVFFAMSAHGEEELIKSLHAADANVAKFYYVPQLSRYLSRGFNLRSIGPVPILSVRNTPLSSLLNAGVKRVFDIGFSSVVLVLSPIVFIPVAIAIKASSPGPVFFRQKRTGYLGRDFMCWKFRTMRVNADCNTLQTSKNDPRKTRVGDFLRRTSIDELPQFINVLLGDMSVVGPRPHMLKDTKDYSALIDRYMVRHFIKPGITGWAQVNGYRGATEQLWKMERRVEYDVWYMENWSFLLDIKIICRTLLNAIHGEKNAF